MIGLGKIGSCYLVYLAEKGHNVIGLDINQDVVQKMQNLVAPYPETSLQDCLTKHRDKIKITSNYMEAIPESDVAVIRVATPSRERGDFDSEYLEQATTEVGRCIPDNKRYYLVIVTSTVMPGTMKEVIAPLLERTSNRVLGKNLGLCYIPDWVALGSVIHNLLYPDVVLIGESDNIAGEYAESIFRPLNNAPIHRMSFYNAETAKLVNNNYISMKISFANMIAEYCENIPGGDAKTILDAIGDDSRIGKKFLKPGLGAGGYCFPRDQKAFIQTAIVHGIKPLLAHATDKINDNIAVRLALKLSRFMQQEKTNKIAILGTTYKPDTIYTEESTVIKIIDLLKQNLTDIEIKTYDPFDKNSIEDILRNQKICFIGTPWKEFSEIDSKVFSENMNENPLIIDSFGILKKLENEKTLRYIRVGTNKFNWEPQCL